MNFQQLRYVREAVRSDLNLTEASNTLNTSQSGVSKQIRELEAELGVEIFVRKGKRLTSLTRAGEQAVKLIERVLVEAENLKRLSGEFSGEQRGRLVIATTHNQARYTLPAIVGRFSQEFPGVQLELRQVTPRQAATSVIRGEADIALATEALDLYTELVTFPCFSWRHIAVAPSGHPLISAPQVSLAQIVEHPLVTYSPEFSGRSQIDEAFDTQGLDPDIRLTAMDADVIKTYVRHGLGVGILSEMAFDPKQDADLARIPLSETLFAPSITKIALQRGALLHAYVYRFVEMVAPGLTAAQVRSETANHASRSNPKSAPREIRVPTFRELLARPAAPITVAAR